MLGGDCYWLVVDCHNFVVRLSSCLNCSLAYVWRMTPKSGRNYTFLVKKIPLYIVLHFAELHNVRGKGSAGRG